MNCTTSFTPLPMALASSFYKFKLLLMHCHGDLTFDPYIRDIFPAPEKKLGGEKNIGWNIFSKNLPLLYPIHFITLITCGLRDGYLTHCKWVFLLLGWPYLFLSLTKISFYFWHILVWSYVVIRSNVHRLSFKKAQGSQENLTVYT